MDRFCLRAADIWMCGDGVGTRRYFRGVIVIRMWGNWRNEGKLCWKEAKRSQRVMLVSFKAKL